MPKKTFQAAKKSENEVILQVKGNQKRLEENCRQIVADQNPIDIFEEKEKGHGRIEYRKTEIFRTLNEGVSLDADWRKYAKTLIAVTRERSVFDTKEKIYKTSSEISLYLASFNSSAEVFHHAIRAHWGIENINHYVRDVSMEEDLSRMRRNPQNFVKLRSTSLNIMRKTKTKNVKNETFKNSLNLSNMLKKYSLLL